MINKREGDLLRKREETGVCVWAIGDGCCWLLLAPLCTKKNMLLPLSRALCKWSWQGFPALYHCLIYELCGSMCIRNISFMPCWHDWQWALARRDNVSSYSGPATLNKLFICIGSVCECVKVMKLAFVFQLPISLIWQCHSIRAWLSSRFQYDWHY